MKTPEIGPNVPIHREYGTPSAGQDPVCPDRLLMLPKRRNENKQPPRTPDRVMYHVVYHVSMH